MDKILQKLCKKLLQAKDLDREEVKEAISIIVKKEAEEVIISAFLAILATKELTSEEIQGSVEAMRFHARPWPMDKALNNMALCDTCGTGGDQSHTINISTLSALLLASLDSGQKIAKHGNRSVSSKVGSADLLEKLGIQLNRPAEACIDDLKELGICFLFAPMWHPAMKNLVSIRSALAFRTIFNLLGPLSNPAPISYQSLGVYSPHFVLKIAHVLAALGREAAYVFSSLDGLDEVSPAAPTYYAQVKEGKVIKEAHLEPSDFGFRKL